MSTQLDNIINNLSKLESEKCNERIKVAMYTRVGKKEQLDSQKYRLYDMYAKGRIDDALFEGMLKRIEAKYQ